MGVVLRTIVIVTATVTLLVVGGITAYQLLEDYKGFTAGFAFTVNLMALVGLAVAVIALMDTDAKARAYPAALRATVTTLPAFAAVGAAVAYVARLQPSPPPWNQLINDYAVLIGSLVGLFAWLVLALFYRAYTAADRANYHTYGMLSCRLDSLKVRLDCERDLLREREDEPDSGLTRRIAYEDARRQCQEIEDKLKSEGLPWVMATGYIEVWTRLHRAEEALINVEPPGTVIASAVGNELRIKDSNMANSEVLLNALRRAVHALGGAQYLTTPPSGVAEQDSTGDTEKITRARAVLSEVQRELNTYRDNAAEGLVQARNHLADTTVFMGLTAYALLATTLLARAPVETIIAAAAYFLVGASIGLFARSQVEAGSDQAIEDYGLSTARLIHTPLFSGLAAIGGVLIAAVTPSLLEGVVPGAVTEKVPSLTNMFSVSPGRLIVAAIFGLTPDLIIFRLRQQSDKYKADLQSTEANQQS
jgi:hypothetical protein